MKMKGKRAVVVYSGGMDSSVLIELLLHLGAKVEAVSFYYGQKHRKELKYANAFCVRRTVPHRVVDISNITGMISNSALTNPDIEVPDGHYEDESMRKTVVPNRNMIMLSIAGGFAVSTKADILATAVHAGDHAIYPDCRVDFINAFHSALVTGNYYAPILYTPFVTQSKAMIAALGMHLDLDFDETWSCYKGGEEHCGLCGTCTERIEALEEGKKIIEDAKRLMEGWL